MNQRAPVACEPPDTTSGESSRSSPPGPFGHWHGDRISPAGCRKRHSQTMAGPLSPIELRPRTFHVALKRHCFTKRCVRTSRRFWLGPAMPIARFPTSWNVSFATRKLRLLLSHAACSPTAFFACTATNADTTAWSPSRASGRRRSLRVDSVHRVAAAAWQIPPRTWSIGYCLRGASEACEYSPVGAHSSLSAPLPMCLRRQTHERGAPRLHPSPVRRASPASAKAVARAGGAVRRRHLHPALWLCAQPEPPLPHPRAGRRLHLYARGRPDPPLPAPAPTDRR